MPIVLVAFLVLASQEKQLESMEAADAIQWICQHSKAKLTFAEGVIPKGRKVVVTKDALDPEHALENGFRMLKSIDVAAIADADVAGLYELVPAAIASKKVAKIYPSVADLPKTEEFCSLSLRLKNASPRDRKSTRL